MTDDLKTLADRLESADRKAGSLLLSVQPGLDLGRENH